MRISLIAGAYLLMLSGLLARDLSAEFGSRLTIGQPPDSISIMKQIRIVQKVIDGDTIMVRWHDRVNLVGINAPEIYRTRKSPEPFSEEAAEFIRKMLPEGTKVTLEFDPENIKFGHKDGQKRLMAYVYLEDGTFLNAEIVKSGYARVTAKTPFMYMEEFKKYEREAMVARLGIWSKP